jgi:hypothetical protein
MTVRAPPVSALDTSTSYRPPSIQKASPSPGCRTAVLPAIGALLSSISRTYRDRRAQINPVSQAVHDPCAIAHNEHLEQRY